MKNNIIILSFILSFFYMTNFAKAEEPRFNDNMTDYSINYQKSFVKENGTLDLDKIIIKLSESQ